MSRPQGAAVAPHRSAAVAHRVEQRHLPAYDDSRFQREWDRNARSCQAHSAYGEHAAPFADGGKRSAPNIGDVARRCASSETSPALHSLIGSTTTLFACTAEIASARGSSTSRSTAIAVVVTA